MKRCWEYSGSETGFFFFLVTSDSKALLISPPKHMQEMSEVWQVTKFKR